MSGRKKNKKEDPPASAPAWMGLYATLMTLLMAFFVVLSTLGIFGGEQFHNAEVSLKRAFTIFPAGGFGMMQRKSASVGRVKPHFKMQSPKVVVKLAGREIEKTLRNTVEEGVQDIQVIYLDDGGVMIRIPEITLFDKGTAVVKKKAYAFLDNVIRLFRDQPYRLKVYGHTDSVVEPGFLYASNWELSAMRSANIIRYLHDNGRIEYSLMEALGYSQYRPLEEDTDQYSISKNSRIEILLEKMQE